VGAVVARNEHGAPTSDGANSETQTGGETLGDLAAVHAADVAVEKRIQTDSLHETTRGSPARGSAP